MKYLELLTGGMRGGGLTRTYRNLYKELCSFRNLELAYRKARKNKRCKKSVQEFELNMERNLLQLKQELETLTYKPRPLRQFVIRDPKTRVISASHFRDRVVHHAVCNVIQPLFERAFIIDSYANQKSKGTHAALRRFDKFKRKASGNGRLVNRPKDNSMVIGYVLKADIKHYFDEVDNGILLSILKHRIKDGNVISLIRKILENHNYKDKNTGMPLGNLTSQFFANVYLNELDYFVKHKLKARYYIRYVDDFILLDKSKERLKYCKNEINKFLKTIKLRLHSEKSKIFPLHRGMNLLGYRVFYHYKLIKRSNLRAIEKRLLRFKMLQERKCLSHIKIIQSIESWMAYAKHANSYNIRKCIMRQLNSITV